MLKNNLPQGWVITNLDKISKIITGRKDANAAVQEGKYKFFTCANEPLNIDTYILDCEAIILPGNGANVGLVLYYSGRFDVYQRTYVVYDSLINTKYLYYFFLCYWAISNKNKQYGSATNYIRLNNLTDFKINVAPRNEQKRIVEKIEAEFEKIDEGIEKLKLVQEQIKQYKQSVLKSAFEGKLYKTTEWEETTLGESIETRNERITPNKENSEMPFIGMDCIKPNCLNIHEKYKLKDTKSVSALFKKNDVLYGRMRSYLNKVWKAEFDGSASAEFIIFKENKKIIADFLKYLLHQQDFVKYATRNASGDRPRVKFESDLADYKFLLPSREEQVQIIFQIEKRFEVADNVSKIVEENLEKAEQLKQSILKKAFEGRLVPQDPTDEPASVLLERIKKERNKK